MSKPVALVVPCYDEERRLDRGEVLRLARARPDLGLVLVDDGSRDGTAALLEGLRAECPEAIEVLRLDRNRGKAEAVRRGLAAAIAGGARVVGYADADLSTPVDELLRLVEAARDLRVHVVLGSRVRLLGTEIERRPARHYLGRVFATVASFALAIPVYDTQCGAKLFRVSPALAAALDRPFGSRWIFDVELLARLLLGAPGAAPLERSVFREVPLHAWRDVAGSKLRAWSMLRAGFQLLGLLLRMRLGRAAAPALPGAATPALGAAPLPGPAPAPAPAPPERERW